ncbi:hypothetical protein BUE80_DR007316 [Diplocarpon rosae]|nr:hypothetical protein BUE80_DR007316 [Diplocarpon rosae]
MMDRAARAKLAKETIDNFVPHILKLDTRAQEGVEQSELIRYLAVSDKKSTRTTSGDLNTTLALDQAETEKDKEARDNNLNGEQFVASTKKSNQLSDVAASAQTTPKIRVIKSDTFDAVQAVLEANPKSRIAALNMASTLQPGGGVLRGARAQEEALCMRSTLFLSLDPRFYELPTLAGIYSPDVLVFRGSDLQDMPKAKWFYTNVISVAALKWPDVKATKQGKEVFAEEGDLEVTTNKIRLIFQIAKTKGITHLVLGALGCGAYRNPPGEVAKIFREVVLGGRGREGVSGIDEVIFAIFDEGENLTSFRNVFENFMAEQGVVSPR